jgi:hypothetical protein
MSALDTMKAEIRKIDLFRFNQLAEAAAFRRRLVMNTLNELRKMMNERS